MKSSYLIFKKHFRLKTIKEVYGEKISKKATRGIDRIGIKKFNEIKKDQLNIGSSAESVGNLGCR